MEKAGHQGSTDRPSKLSLDFCIISHLIVAVVFFVSAESLASMLVSHPIVVNAGRPLTFNELLFFSDQLCQNTTRRSLIWIFLRATSMPDHGTEISDLEQEMADKEMQYASTTWSHHQLFDYSSLQEEYGLQRWRLSEFELSARNLVNRFLRLCQKAKILYPVYNKRKNIGRLSATEYLLKSARGRFGVDQWTEEDRLLNMEAHQVTTFDLECLYVQEGIKVGGPCEVRRSWKTNDLKPRLYYANGGDSYFASRYMKALAVFLMESLESTEMRHRQQPTEYLNLLYEDDPFVITWDLTSFTTNISELKFYLWNIARILENEYGDSAIIPLLDIREGLVMTPLWELLDNYNEQANVQPAFDVSRLEDFIDAGGNPVRRQQNSGMLGVPGNIGFSTSLHGFIAASVVGSQHCVCVGDDAIALSRVPEELMDTIETLGKIQREKFAMMGPSTGQIEFGRFLKRRLTRSEDGLSLDFLFNLPVPSFFDGKVPEGRTAPIRFSYQDRVRSVASTVSRLFWDPNFLRALYEDEERKAVANYLKTGYRMLGLPMAGFLPGYKLVDPETQVPFVATFVLPPVRFQYFSPTEHIDWLELLYAEEPQQYFTVPIVLLRGRTKIPSGLGVGDTFLSTSSAVLRILEDFGYVTKKAYIELTQDYSIENLRKLKKVMKGEDATLGYIVTVDRDFPSWMSSFVEDPELSDMVALSGDI